MTYNEAIKLYNGSRRKMAESLGISVQAVAFYGKKPDEELPPHRVFMIKTLLGIKDNLEVKITAKGEVV